MVVFGLLAAAVSVTADEQTQRASKPKPVWVSDGRVLVVAKRRSDLFRHLLLGFGSGDLLVKTAGAHAQQFEMHNVLLVGSKLQLIQQMLQTREVVSGV